MRWNELGLTPKDAQDYNNNTFTSNAGAIH